MSGNPNNLQDPHSRMHINATSTVKDCTAAPPETVQPKLLCLRSLGPAKYLSCQRKPSIPLGFSGHCSRISLHQAHWRPHLAANAPESQEHLKPINSGHRLALDGSLWTSSSLQLLKTQLPFNSIRRFAPVGTLALTSARAGNSSPPGARDVKGAGALGPGSDVSARRPTSNAFGKWHKHSRGRVSWNTECRFG